MNARNYFDSENTYCCDDDYFSSWAHFMYMTKKRNCKISLEEMFENKT